MSLSEFQLIERYFSACGVGRPDVIVGVGDDAALVTVAPGQQLALAIDTLVAGVHFPPDVAPADLGHKALAVNLSDLAAMGAEPAWATLALTLPEVDESWLAGFATGFAALAVQHGVQLIGGDTTRGPLTITVQVHGLLAAGKALRRNGAGVGDEVYVTGTLGDAAVALRLWQSEARRSSDPDAISLYARLHRPTPRMAMGLALRDLASAAVDVSDGLAADLAHVLDASGVGATLDVTRLPLSTALRSHWGGSESEARRLALSGGDDYELCFTAPAARRAAVMAAATHADCAVTTIGSIDAAPGLRLLDAGGAEMVLSGAGYDHFAAS